MPQYLDVALEAARAAGHVLLDWQGRFQTREKGPKDLVTEADCAAQEAVREIIRKSFPGHDFLGEEDAAERKAKGLPPIGERTSDFRWVVDPLDGTTNYVHHLPGYAVSIALQQGNEIVLGVVHDPLSEEFFVAECGRGAKLNNQPITTSGCSRMEKALVAVSFSPHVERDSPEIRRFVEILLAAQSVRRMGSAALNLCYVATGRLDAYVATSVSIWDIAAGLLMVTEAGGAVSALDGGALSLERPELIATSSMSLANELVRVIGRANRGIA